MVSIPTAPVRRLTAWALIVGTLVFLAGNILHPKEYTRGHEHEQLETIADAYTRWQLTHFLTFIAILCFVAVVVGLALLLARARGRQAAIGAALGLGGLICIAAVLALDGFTWGALGQVYSWPGIEKASIANALHAVQEARWNLPYYVGALGWLVGLVVLAHGLMREGMVAKWPAVALALGAVLVGIEAGIQNNAYFIVAAVVLAAGGVAVAMGLLQQREPA